MEKTGKVENLKSWKKGQSGNPKGRPKLNSDVKALRKLALDKYIEVTHKYLMASVNELKQASKDLKIPAIEAVVISVILNCIKQGDIQKLERLLERIIGKPKEDSEPQQSFYERLVDFVNDCESEEAS